MNEGHKIKIVSINQPSDQGGSERLLSLEDAAWPMRLQPFR